MKIKRPLLTATIFFCFLIIAALTIVLTRINGRLNNLAVLLEQTAEQHLTANVALDTDLPLNSSFQIPDNVTVGISMVVETVIPLNVEIPVNENILVPFKIGVKDYIRLDTTIMITEDVFANVEDTLHIDQKFTMPTSKKRGITVPIIASIPINERVKINVNEAIPVHSVVPVDLLIIDTLPVGLNIKVPVNINVPVRIPVNTWAKVSFPDSIPVVGEIPVSVIIPVDIPLTETALAPYFKNLAQGLRGLIKLKNPEPNLNKNN